MTDNDNGGGRHRSDHTRFKWTVVASLIALVLILGVVENLAGK